MYLISPLQDDTNIKDIIAKLDQDLDQFLTVEKTLVHLTMPKFKIESSYDVKLYLRNLGLESIFRQDSADLSGLNEDATTKSPYVNDIVQKAFIEVNEEGTEAAAATATLMKSLPPRIHLDKPFLFFIRDDDTGLNLFSGRVSNPQV